MNNLKQQIKDLDVKSQLKDLIEKVIRAETFNLERTYQSKIFISKHVHEPFCGRVWVKVIVLIEAKDVSLFQLRPFIDVGAMLLSTESGMWQIEKTYFLYDEFDENGDRDFESIY